MEGSNAKKRKEYGKDPLLPTDGNYYKPVSAPSQRINLSNKEVQDKLEVYAKVSNKVDRHFAYQRLKQKHIQRIEKLKQDHTKQDKYYGDGNRAQLPQTSHEVIKDDRHYANQSFNNGILKEAKEQQRKDGLSKNFKQQRIGMRHNFNHSKNKGLDRDR